MKLALEAIDFQNGMLFKELTMHFEEMKKLSEKDAKENETPGLISATIKRHTGLQFVIDFGSNGPAVEVPDLHKNNPLVSNIAKHFLNDSDGKRMIASAEGMVRGTVNIKKSFVSGIFTELVNKMHFPLDMAIGKKFTAGECAAIMLHEIGHIFTYLECISRTVTTNQVLAGVARGLDNTSSVEEREVILLSAKKALSLSELDTKSLAKSGNKKVIEIVVLNAAIKEAASEIGSNIYDANNWEYLSDEFASRHGAGREMAIGLEKLYKSQFNISFRSTPVFYLMEAFKVVLLIGGIALASSGAFVPMLIGRIGFNVALMFLALDSAGDGTYDRPGVRIKRIRNQVAENLKQDNLSTEDKKALKEDLVALDAALYEIEDRLQFFAVIWKFFSSNDRKRYDAERLQQELESLVANDLFTKADDLKALA